MTPYTNAFFDAQKNESKRSARKILQHLCAMYDMGSAVDVGCGAGVWLEAAREFGISDLTGVDGEYTRDMNRANGFMRFHGHDLASPLDLGRRFDLVISVEVAEHLPPEAARTFVETLTRHGDLVLFSAALPFQGGVGHRNENWLEYWAALFAEFGYRPIDVLRTKIWRDPDIAWWYRQNCMLFRARSAEDRVMPTQAATQALSLPHPEFLMRAVRRRPKRSFATTLPEDLSYYTELTDAILHATPRSYGREFDDHVRSDNAIESYDDLKDRAAELDIPVLRDALAPIRLRQPALPRLAPTTSPPDFLCIGVQKAATTWLYELARTHRQLRPAAVKELNFFNRRSFAPGTAYHHDGMQRRVAEMIRNYAFNAETLDPTWLRLLTHLLQAGTDAAWYEAIFQFYPDRTRLRGEFTPEYVMLPVSGIAELKAYLPNVRLILMLRDPVERVESHIRMVVQQAPVAEPFADLLAREQSVVERSRYDRLLPLWRKHFGDDQLKILCQDGVSNEPAAVARQIAEFLRIDEQGFSEQAVQRRVHVGRQTSCLGDETRAHLATELAEAIRIYRELRDAG